jgi:peptide/nickel transport system substrate-binding protein
MRRLRVRYPAALVAALMLVAACGGGGGGGGQGAAAPTGPPQRGGELTVLEDSAFAGGWPSGLDPATSTTGGANVSQLGAIFGGLFTLTAADDGSDAKITPNQVESYELADNGRTLRLKIRSGITFSDGTPFDAQAVAFNFTRDVTSTCTCAPRWPLVADNPITVEDPLTVVVKFSQPNAAVVSSFPSSNVNWIVSPTALQKAGPDQFKVNPVGAGPFTVVSNQLSSLLVLQRNPTYFKPDRPYLDKLTFQSIGGDQPAYQALLAGQAQAYEGLSTTPLLDAAQQQGALSVTVQPATSPYVIQLNTKAAPFDDVRARQAIYAATDFDSIAKGVFKGLYPVSQDFTGPGGLFHREKVEGYPPFDLEKAKQLVQQLGGLTVNLGTLRAYVAQQVMTALQTQWQAAGITVKTENYELSNLVQQFNSGKWQAMLQTAGAWDPASGVGVAFRFSSTSPFSGVADPQLDQMLNSAAASVDQGQRAQLYTQAGKYISDNAYAPFGLAFAPANLATKGVYGPGLTTKIPPLVVNSGIIWDEVWRSAQ